MRASFALGDRRRAGTMCNLPRRSGSVTSWIPALVAGLIALAGAYCPALAQDRGPVLLLQPGMLSADFLSAKEGYPATSGFNLRFSTLVPTSFKWWTLIIGASVTPYGTSGITPRSTNTPLLFVGNVFPGVSARHTGGWFDVQFPVYLTYAFDGGGEHNRAIYGRDFVGEVALQWFIGQKVLRDLGPAFSRLRVYVMANQVLTPNADVVTGKVDRFNPVALYGITIPIGGRSAAPRP